jgi:hypothetical protein
VSNCNKSSTTASVVTRPIVVKDIALGAGDDLG